MVRVRSVLSAKRRKKRVLKQTKGQFGQKHSRYQQAKRSLIRGLAFAFRDRKVRKRDFRALWIVRISAACRQAGITYSAFMNGLNKAKVSLDRKMLADLAVNSPAAFQKLVDVSKESVSGQKKKAKAK